MILHRGRAELLNLRRDYSPYNNLWISFLI